MMRSIAERADAIFREQMLAEFRAGRSDFQVLSHCGVAVGHSRALVISPYAWAGETASIHIHVWTAIILGGTIASLPIALTLLYSGKAMTRHSVAVGQILLTALFIHLWGGRIESHFLIFVSLAFLAFYRDWKVLVTASVLVGLGPLSPWNSLATIGLRRCGRRSLALVRTRWLGRFRGYRACPRLPSVASRAACACVSTRGG